MVLLTDVARSWVISAIRRMVTQWLHFLFSALADHDVINIATGCLNANFLKLVLTCIGAVFAVQSSRKRWIWLVWRSFDAHDFSVF